MPFSAVRLYLRDGNESLRQVDSSEEFQGVSRRINFDYQNSSSAGPTKTPDQSPLRKDSEMAFHKATDKKFN